jgi:hypothetical protein
MRHGLAVVAAKPRVIISVREDLISAIEAVVVRAAATGYSNASATNDLYENYVSALCLAAARQRRAIPQGLWHLGQSDR